MNITFEEIAKEWEDYKNSSQTQEIKQAILNKAKQNPHNMWTVCFCTDKAMYRQLDLLDCQEHANKSLRNIEKALDVPKVLLDMVASTCFAYCQYKDDINYGKIDEEKMNLWINTFSTKYPHFIDSLKEEEQRLLDNRAKHKQNYISSLPNEKAVVETITLSSPLVFKANGKHVDVVPEETLKDIVNHYNIFRLDSYMQLPYETSDTQLKIENNMGYFSFDFTEKISENDKPYFLDKLKKSLSGQLSDGWGESFNGQLIGNDIIYTSFDSDNVEIYVNNLSKKFKMK